MPSASKRDSALRMRERADGTVFLEGLTWHGCPDMAHLHDVLASAAAARHNGSTAMNAQSSRSHVLLLFRLRLTDQQGQTADVQLTFVGRCPLFVFFKLFCIIFSSPSLHFFF
jgi:hypothetical protein